MDERAVEKELEQTEQKEQQRGTAPSCIIGIGASAGGLEAVSELLESLPVDTGMAFVVIQHLSPDYKSMLSEILARHTFMPVEQAENGTKVQSNTVYIIPPRYFLLLDNGCFTLKEYSAEKKRINHPVDVFFRSLASHERRKAVAVILSGTGSDGTTGAKAVQESGGVVLVQTPESAKFDGMPQSAIQAGMADKTLTPSDIAEELTHISIAMKGVRQNSTDHELLNTIFTILKNACNINFTYYKTSTVMRRIQRRMVINHVESLNDYIALLESSSRECEAMSREMLIGVTNFFRDPESFEILKENVIKPLVKGSKIGQNIRVWVPGCSTGEEAYSIAILFSEAMEELELNVPVKIFATDLDKEAIAAASAGEYGECITENLSATRLGRFFVRKNGKYCISHDLRHMIVFAPQNILQDPPFGKLDLISCRNMLIYFQSSLQKKVLETFDMVLKPGGFLFLGAAESVGSDSGAFTGLYAGVRIYLHTSAESVHSAGTGKPFISLLERHESVKRSSLMLPDPASEEETVQLDVLERFLPSTFVINEHNKLIHTFGACTNYLRIPTGKVEFDLYSMLTNDLRIPVSNLVQQVREEGRAATFTEVHIRGEQNAETVTLVASPLIGNELSQEAALIAVTAAQVQAYTAPKDAVSYDEEQASVKRIADLENELVRTKTKLKSAISELESVNEELQAANEELLTSNEELQSSNEELQSVNEELYTVNAEYQQKLQEVTMLNNDVSFFLSSAFVGVLFLDRELKIRRFTSFIHDAFNVVEQDIGRSVQCMSYNFPNINLTAEARQVMASHKAKDMDVVSIAGRFYFARIAPFMTQEDKQDGIVVTFVDTTEQVSSKTEMNNIAAALMSEKAANRDKDNFLSRVSHDMRSPLYEITGLLELTQRIDGLPAEASQNIAEMMGSANYLLGVINDTVSVGKIRQKGIAISRKPVMPEQMLKHVMSIVRFQAENAGVLLSENLSQCGCEQIYADENHVMQILVNLLGNAIKYTPAGGKVDFEVSAEKANDRQVRHIYKISDNGVGISPAFQKKMFVAFEQEDADGNVHGTGLGLYIVKQLLDAMGGTIRCESQKDVGTTFTVALTYDIAKEKAPGQTAESRAEPTGNLLAGRRVLVCDDHPINLKIAEKMLQSAGAVVETAVNGKEGLLLYSKRPAHYFDAVLMDIRMPVMDGIQTTRAIRTADSADAATLPIIAMTADAFAEDKQRGFAAGLTDYVTKPISLDMLVKTLAAAIDSDPHAADEAKP